VGIEHKVTAVDTGLFNYVESETSDDDRRSLLAIHSAIARRLGTFSYLEIGSHLGGSLQAVIADPRCRRIVSIDPRPTLQPDDRGASFTYDDNSTMRMLLLLEDVPDADLMKLETIELSTEDIPAGSVARPDLCFVDGEHTYGAALRDARFCRAAMQGAGVVMFHDRRVVETAILAFLRETSGPMTAYPLRSSLFAVELGAGTRLLHEPEVAAQVGPHPVALWRAASRLGASRSIIRFAGRARQALRR
jgi:Methyltransferase domain